MLTDKATRQNKIKRYFIVFYKYKLITASVTGYIDMATDYGFLNKLKTIELIQSTNKDATEIIILNIIELNKQDAIDWSK